MIAGKVGSLGFSVVNFIPRTTAVRARRKRLAEYLGAAEPAIVGHLPAGAEHYEYYSDAPPDLKGWAGYFKNGSEIATVKELFEKRVTVGS